MVVASLCQLLHHHVLRPAQQLSRRISSSEDERLSLADHAVLSKHCKRADVLSGLCACRLTRWSMRSWLPFPWGPNQQPGASPSRTLLLGSCRCSMHCMSLQSICVHMHSRAQILSKLVKMLPDENAADQFLPGCNCAIADRVRQRGMRYHLSWLAAILPASRNG